MRERHRGATHQPPHAPGSCRAPSAVNFGALTAPHLPPQGSTVLCGSRLPWSHRGWGAIPLGLSALQMARFGA
jgi:hypothetical protein